MTDWAVITPSYDVDFVRCKILCRSMDQFLIGDWHHYIVVDPPDMKLFKPLAGPRRSVVAKPDIMPKGTYKFLNTGFTNPRFRRLWWSWSGPVAGWQVQQLVKFAMGTKVSQSCIMCCDSDMFFVREFDLETFTRSGKTRFYRTAKRDLVRNSPDPQMYETTENFLGLSSIARAYHNYGENMVTWTRANLMAMLDHISHVHQTPWHKLYRKPAMISEYISYGMFVDEVRPDTNGHFYENTKPCKTLLYPPTEANFSLDEFCSSLAPHQVAIGIQSNLGYSTATLEEFFERLVKIHA